MTLTDTGPLIALIDHRDKHHAQVKGLIDWITPPLVTTEACLTEALHILGSVSGWHGQSALWHLVNIGLLQILAPAGDGPARAQAYMERYLDQPCDYADATLLVAAEDLGSSSVWTIDKHFYAYRLNDGRHLQAIGML